MIEDTCFVLLFSTFEVKNQRSDDYSINARWAAWFITLTHLILILEDFLVICLDCNKKMLQYSCMYRAKSKEIARPARTNTLQRYMSKPHLSLLSDYLLYGFCSSFLLRSLQLKEVNYFT